jgi:voltage-gated potassium channel
LPVSGHPRRSVVVSVLWAVVSSLFVLGVYFLIGRFAHDGWSVGITLVVGAGLFAFSLTRQFRQILSSDQPELRAVQALGVIVAIFLVVFAATYLSFPQGSFSESLDATSALYVAIATLTTVGYGDITPISDSARIVVSLQMILDLVLIGVIVRSVISAARSTAEQRRATPETGFEDGESID